MHEEKDSSSDKSKKRKNKKMVFNVSSDDEEDDGNDDDEYNKNNLFDFSTNNDRDKRNVLYNSNTSNIKKTSSKSNRLSYVQSKQIGLFQKNEMKRHPLAQCTNAYDDSSSNDCESDTTLIEDSAEDSTNINDFTLSDMIVKDKKSRNYKVIEENLVLTHIDASNIPTLIDNSDININNDDPIENISVIELNVNDNCFRSRNKPLSRLEKMRNCMGIKDKKSFFHDQDLNDSSSNENSEESITNNRAKFIYGSNRTMLLKQDEPLEIYSSRYKQLKEQGLNDFDSDSSENDSTSDEEINQMDNDEENTLIISKDNKESSMIVNSQKTNLKIDKVNKRDFRVSRNGKNDSDEEEDNKLIIKKKKLILSMHELRETGENRQQIEQIEYLIEGLNDENTFIKRLAWLDLIKTILKSLSLTSNVTLEDVRVDESNREECPYVIGFKKQNDKENFNILETIRIHGYLTDILNTMNKTMVNEVKIKKDYISYLLVILTLFIFLKNKNMVEEILQNQTKHGSLQYFSNDYFNKKYVKSLSEIDSSKIGYMSPILVRKLKEDKRFYNQLKTVFNEYPLVIDMPVDDSYIMNNTSKYDSDRLTNYLNVSKIEPQDLFIFIIDQSRSFNDPILIKMIQKFMNQINFMDLDFISNVHNWDQPKVRALEMMCFENIEYQKLLFLSNNDFVPSFLLGIIECDNLQAKMNIPNYNNIESIPPKNSTLSLFITLTNSNNHKYTHRDNNLSKIIGELILPSKENNCHSDKFNSISLFFIRLFTLACTEIKPDNKLTDDVKHLNADSDSSARTMLAIALLTNIFTTCKNIEYSHKSNFLDQLSKTVLIGIEDPSLVTVLQIMLLGLVGWPSVLKNIGHPAIDILERFIAIGEQHPSSSSLNSSSTSSIAEMKEESACETSSNPISLIWNDVFGDVKPIFRSVAASVRKSLEQ